jgi:hypothetical protein
MAVQIPPSFRPLRELAGKRDRLRQAERAAAAELRRLDVELAKAVELDRKAYADRLARDIDAESPGAKEEEKVRAKIAEVGARRKALVLAVQDADGEIDAEIAARVARSGSPRKPLQARKPGSDMAKLLRRYPRNVMSSPQGRTSSAGSRFRAGRTKRSRRASTRVCC